MSVENRKTLIILSVGDVKTTDYPTGVLLENIDSIWDLYTELEETNVELHDLYVKRDSVLLVLGSRVNLVDTRIAGDSEVKSSQAWDHLQAMLTQINQQIAANSASGGVISVGLLTTTVPDSPPTYWCGRSANDSIYGGDPYKRRRKGL